MLGWHRLEKIMMRCDKSLLPRIRSVYVEKKIAQKVRKLNEKVNREKGKPVIVSALHGTIHTTTKKHDPFFWVCRYVYPQPQPPGHEQTFLICKWSVTFRSTEAGRQERSPFLVRVPFFFYPSLFDQQVKNKKKRN